MSTTENGNKVKYVIVEIESDGELVTVIEPGSPETGEELRMSPKELAENQADILQSLNKTGTYYVALPIINFLTAKQEAFNKG